MNCTVCKKPIITTGFYQDLKERLEKAGTCHSCDIWLGHWQQRNNPTTLRISGNQYIIVNDGTGIELTVRKQGKLMTVHAWHQGLIPLAFRNALSNNATYAHRITVTQL